MDQLSRGRAAEGIALAYLILKGFVPLERGFRAGRAEVDLVMTEGETVVFVEVKLRGAGSLGRGAESISRPQRGRLEDAAAWWLARHRLTDLRFDAVLLDEEGDGLRLCHVRGAFPASGRRPV